MPTFGTISSAFPDQNILFNSASGITGQQIQQNELMNTQRQQAIGANQLEYVSRAASVVDQAPESEQPVLYQQLGQQLVDQGIIPKLPPYPGPARIKQLAGMGIPAEKQIERQDNRQGWGQLGLGDDTDTVPAAPTPAAVTPPAAADAPAVVPQQQSNARPGGSPALTSIAAPGGAKVTVAQAVAPRFQGLVNDLEAAGYTLDPKTTGGYNPRNIAGTNTPSHHASGNAIDVNWQRNARGANTPSDLPPELARSLAAKHGLVWGGDWTGETRDPMHFEVAGATRTGGGIGDRIPGAYNVAGSVVAAPGGAVAPGAAPPGQQQARAASGGMLAGLQPDQIAQLRALKSAGRPFSEGIALIQRFHAANRADAAAVRSETQQAQSLRIQQENLRLSQQSGALAADKWKAEQEKTSREVANPFGNSDTGLLRFMLSDPKSDPKSPTYHAAWAAYANPQTVNGVTMPGHVMTPFRMPLDEDGVPVTTYDKAPATLAPGDVAEYRKIRTAGSTLLSSLDDFSETARKASLGERIATVAGQPTDLSSSWTNVALMAKGQALYELGVLSGPDMSVIRGALADPTTFMGAAASTETINKQVGRIKRLIETRLEQAKESYLPGVKSSPQSAPAVAPPEVGTVKKGYRFNGGDPSDPTSWVKVQ